MALTVNNKMFVSWADIEDLVQELWKKVVIGSMPVNSIHGLKRGGYIPAVMLSHQLSLPYSEIIYPDTLVVDDICDSGNTIKEAPGLYTATLHYKESAIVKPTIYASLLVNESQWISYPWENDDSEMIQDYLAK